MIVRKNTYLILLVVCPLLLTFVSSASSEENGLSVRASLIEELKDEISQINSRLDEIELEINSPKFLTKAEKIKGELVELENGLSSIGRHVSLGQMFLSGQFFTIYMGLFGIAALIFGLTGAVVLNRVQSQIKKRVKNGISEGLKPKLDISAKYIVATTHTQQAFAWWEHYMEDYRNFLHRRSFDASIIKDIRLSRQISEEGLRELSKLPAAEKNTSEYKNLEAGLINHWIFNATAEVLINQRHGKDVDKREIDKLREYSRRNLNFVHLNKDNELWYSYLETASFCLLKFGHASEKIDARENLLSILDFDKSFFGNYTANPSKGWLQFAHSWYFPIKNENAKTPKGKYIDLHDLYNIPNFPT